MNDNTNFKDRLKTTTEATQTILSLLRKRILIVTLIFLIFILFINAILFTYTSTGYYVRADGWRFLFLYLEPWINGTFTFKTLWSDFHPQPLTALIFIINAEYFSLNMIYEGLFGTMFILPIAFLIFRAYIKSFKKLDFMLFFIFIIMMSILFGINGIEKFSWSLVTLSNIGIFVFLCAVYFLNLARIEDSKSNIIYFFLMINLLLLIDANSAKIFIGSIFIYLVIELLDSSSSKKKYVIIFMLLLISMILSDYFLKFVGFHQQFNSGLFESLNSIISVDFYGFIKSFSIGLSNGLLNYDYMREIGIKEGWIQVIALIITIVYLYIIYLSIRNKQYKISAIPIILMFFSLLFVIAVIVYRYPPDSFSAYIVASPRYTKFYELGFIGALWNLAIYYDKNIFLEICKKIVVFLLCLLLLTQSFYGYKQWKVANYLNNINLTQIELLKNYQELNIQKPAIWIIGFSGFSEKHIIFLKKHKLNIFKENSN